MYLLRATILSAGWFEFLIIAIDLSDFEVLNYIMGHRHLPNMPNMSGFNQGHGNNRQPQQSYHPTGNIFLCLVLFNSVLISTYTVNCHFAIRLLWFFC